MRWNKISDAVIKRLPLYLRVLEEAQKAGIDMLSSNQLGERAGVSPALVRKDLAWFGEFGKQGVGYDVSFLKRELKRILHLDEDVPMVMVGIGSLGQALARYNVRRYETDPNFTLKLVGLFDVDRGKVGKEVAGEPIRHIDELSQVIADTNARLAAITVPAAAAQDTADILVKAGIKAILNFAPTTISVPEEVKLVNADLSLELQRLAFYTG